MRMNRFDWLARFFTVKVPRAKTKREKKEKEPKPLRKWLVMGEVYAARTKSEARALAKRALGYKGRLPIGTVVVEKRKRD